MSEEPGVTGLVLAGAAALGAYQVGVLDHLATAVAADLGTPFAVDVLSGTSAGAINAGAVASSADDVATAVARLVLAWTSLRLEQMLRPSTIELLAMSADLVAAPGRLRRALQARGARGGLVDAGPVRRLCATAVDPAAIDRHLHAGRLRGLAVATTQVATGRAIVFYQAAVAPHRTADSPLVATRIEPAHVLASAAVPLLFPAMAIDGELYCDGGLRQLVPLSPALHLGANRVVVVSAIARAATDPAATERRRAVASSPLYLVGKALEALFADGVDTDLDRLQQINHLLDAGSRRFGPGFPAELDAGLAAMHAPPMRPVDVVDIRPSRELGMVAADYVASPEFARRARGTVARLFRWLAGNDGARAGGLLGFLLFDGGFASKLIALGRADARAQHARLVELFTPDQRASDVGPRTSGGGRRDERLESPGDAALAEARGPTSEVQVA